VEAIRFWAGTHSVYFDELASEIGKESLLHFNISPDFVSEGSKRCFGLKISEPNKGKLIHIDKMGRNKVIVLANLRTSERINKTWYWIDAPFEVGISSRQDEAELEKIAGNSDSPEVHILGGLNFGSIHFVDCLPSYRCRIHSFESIILDEQKEEFGTWHQVSKYREIGMDPDVTRDCVLVADIEILSLVKVPPVIRSGNSRSI
jgi:hypothetical protein